MTKFFTSITAFALAVGVAACGSSATHTSTSAPPAQTSTGRASTQTQQLATRAQRVLRQMATQTGNLATGNSSVERQARSRLAQLQSDATTVGNSAAKRLPAGSPARTLIVRASQRASSAANALQHAHLTAATRNTLKTTQSTLRSLSSAIGNVQATPSSQTVTKIGNDLQALRRQLNGQIGASTNRASTQTKRLAARAQHVLGQMATETGKLATGNSSTERQARSRLAQLQSDATTIENNAAKRLPAGNPGRTLIVRASQRASSAANALRHAHLSAATRNTLKATQSTLRSLSSAIGNVQATPSSQTARKIGNDLQALRRELSGQIASAS